MTAGTIVEKLLDRSATIKTTVDEIIVKFDYFRGVMLLKSIVTY
ncbi:MAG: hypothetical protein OCU17_08605 [Methanophagales archaeon]|nr:hypothetical protein [Methanophagales archaeon]